MVSTTTTNDTSTLSATLTAMLKQADLNGDGVVSQSELSSALGTDSTLATELVTAADADGDGAMSATEFASFADKFAVQTGLALLNAQESTAAVGALYAALDTDGSAKLTATEMTSAVAAASAAEESVDSTTTDTTTATTTTDTSEETSESDTTTDSVTTAGWTIEDLIAPFDVTGDGTVNKDDIALQMLKAAQDKDAEQADQSNLDNIITFIREQLAALLNKTQSS